METVFIIIILCLIGFLGIKIYRLLKIPKIPALCLITGGVKTGKTAFGLIVALRTLRKRRILFYIKCFFVRIFNVFRKKGNKLKYPIYPILYSNIPLAGIKYAELTTAHFLRQVKLEDNCVVFVDEASLLADSQLIKDKQVNIQLLLFFKLFGHEANAICILTTHDLTDLHYAIKRVCSNYFYIHSTSKYIPFFCFARVREERFSEDNTVINAYNEDIELSLRLVIFRKSVFKKYDYRCYSILTDHLPVVKDMHYLSVKDYKRNRRALKIDKIVSFRPEFGNIDILKPMEEKQNDK